jgi:uncharacterized protein (DUF3820 family)
MNDLKCEYCGLTNEFIIKPNGLILSAYCEKCNNLLENIRESKITKRIIPFGKYAGTKICEMWDEEQINYLRWLVEQDFLKQDLFIAISQHLFNIKKNDL